MYNPALPGRIAFAWKLAQELLQLNGQSTLISCVAFRYEHFSVYQKLDYT